MYLAGISRSASVVIAYLMTSSIVEMKEFQLVWDFVKERRRIVHPNQGFQTQLKEYEAALI